MMGIRAGVSAILVLSGLCGCADNKPPPVLLARQALQAAESGPKSQQASAPAAPSPARSNAAAPAATGNPTYAAGPPSSRLPSPAAPSGQNVASPGYPPRAAGPAPRTHLVQPGDTLFGMAREYYGDGRKWPLILQANPQVTDPGKLMIGQSLAIPPET